MVVKNQDRDVSILNYDPQQTRIEPRWHNQTLMGYNIMHGEIILGTFDEFDEAVRELNRLNTHFMAGTTKEEVRGYCDFDIKEALPTKAKPRGQMSVNNEHPN